MHSRSGVAGPLAAGPGSLWRGWIAYLTMRPPPPLHFLHCRPIMHSFLNEKKHTIGLSD